MGKITLIFSMLLLALFACEKVDLKRLMYVKTTNVFNLSESGVVYVDGEIVDLGEGATEYGVYYFNAPGSERGYRISSEHGPVGIGSFTIAISDLALGVTYYTRTYIKGVDGKIVLGNEISFTIQQQTEGVLLRAVSHNNENRIGSGDFKKTDLFEISNLPSGNTWDYYISIDGRPEVHGKVTISGSRGTINNPLSLNDWLDIGYDKELNVTLKLSKTGVATQSLAYTIPKEQYKIKTWEDLQGVQYDLAGSYTMEKNITFPKPGTNGFDLKGFNPIGTTNIPFTGTFDGKGHEIFNLYIDCSGQDNIALFGYVNGSSSKIKNVGVHASEIIGRSYVGGLVGYIGDGTITNSYATGDIDDSNNYAGGFVGYFDNGTIENCYATGDIDECDSYIGGFAGYINNGTIKNCYAMGDVYDCNKFLGGFVGYINNSGTVENCYAAGDVSGLDICGGFGGHISDSSTITNCYWDTTDNDANTSVGSGSSSGITGKTETAMRDEKTYQHWNFTTIWRISYYINDGYPFLRDVKVSDD